MGGTEVVLARGEQYGSWCGSEGRLELFEGGYVLAVLGDGGVCPW